MQDRISSFIERLIKSIYRPVLALALRNRYFTTAAGLALLMMVGGYVASGRIALEFSPGAESDDVEASIELPYGSPIEETVRVQDRVVAIEPESGAHVVGATLGKANDAAYAQFPDRWLYFVRVDDPTADIVLPTW